MHFRTVAFVSASLVFILFSFAGWLTHIDRWRRSEGSDVFLLSLFPGQTRDLWEKIRTRRTCHATTLLPQFTLFNPSQARRGLKNKKKDGLLRQNPCWWLWLRGFPSPSLNLISFLYLRSVRLLTQQIWMKKVWRKETCSRTSLVLPRWSCLFQYTVYFVIYSLQLSEWFMWSVHCLCSMKVFVQEQECNAHH